jgi:predicted permease
VASLLLVRSTARVREIAIRTAIGAGARRLARQLLTENLLIACGGGALGLLLAWSAVKGLIAASPRSIPRVGEVTVDLPILLFALAVTVATGLLAGLAPVISAGHADIAVALKESSHATGARRGNSIRSAFVIAEIAITLVLVFAAALLLRSLITAETAYPGFVPDHVLALELNLPSPAYKSPDSQTRFYSRLAGEIRAIPGVVDAGVVMCPPAAGDCYDWFYSVTDKPAPPQSDVPVAFFNVADTHYLKTMRIALREGRSFTDADREGAPTVALVNEKFARQWWPNESAVGHRIKSGGPYMQGPVYEIVGVVGNVSRLGLDEKPGPEVILPFAQGPARGMSLMIRTAGDPQALTAAIRQRVAAVDHNLPIRRLRTLEENLADSLQRRRFSTILLAAFAGLAIFLSAIGIYGILNYCVAVREDDIAVRLALGAQQSAILRWAGSAVLRLAASGTILGLAGAWAASHALESMVYGVSPRNPVMMLAAIGGVLAIAAVAAAVPVWRAMKVDAVKRLHHA